MRTRVACGPARPSLASPPRRAFRAETPPPAPCAPPPRERAAGRRERARGPPRARAEGRRRGARGGQPAEAASRAGGRSVSRDPGRTGTGPVGPGGRQRAGDTWYRRGSGSLEGPGDRGPARPSSLETLCRHPHLLPAVLASSGQRGEERPGALRSSPSSAPGPDLVGSRRAPPAAAPLRRTPGPGYRPSGSFASILVCSLPLPTPLLSGPAVASVPPPSTSTRSEPQGRTAALCVFQRFLVH